MSDYSELKRLAEAALEQNHTNKHELAIATRKFFDGCFPESILALIADNERLARELAFTEQWYAVRMERLGYLGKAHGIWPEMAAIIANGTADHQEPPTYAQQLVRANHRAKEAESERDKLRAEVEALRKDADRYRWLRDVAVNVSFTAPAIMRVDDSGNPANHGAAWSSLVWGEEADAAIDTAMSQGKQP